MKEIPFSKLTSFGNNFVVLDETEKPVLTEEEKRAFAYYATDVNFGVGCDNFLVVQRCNENTLNDINAIHQYWDNFPSTNSADLIFRMFEPDGIEALSCGNGLMCIARYLFNTYGIKKAEILTKVPSSTPGEVTIGCENGGADFFANLGRPQRVSDTLVDRKFLTRHSDNIDMIKHLEIRHFRATDVSRFFNGSDIVYLSGYLVFTGEPHLVILSDAGFSTREPAKHIFPTTIEESLCGQFSNKRISTGSELVNFIGHYFLKHYKDIFPKGININFVRNIPGENAIEYRCFERGINKETFACGTGALACAFVMHSLGMVDTDDIRLWPYLCRIHKHDAEIKVKQSNGEWRIFGQPTYLFNGHFATPETPPTNDSPLQ